MNKRSEIVVELVDNISSLAFVNRMTGLWDHLRGELCNGALTNSDLLHAIIQTEKKSRFYVEQRAIHRGGIDEKLMILMKTYQRNGIVLDE